MKYRAPRIKMQRMDWEGFIVTLQVIAVGLVAWLTISVWLVLR